jgi:hypothetical protein
MRGYSAGNRLDSATLAPSTGQVWRWQHHQVPARRSLAVVECKKSDKPRAPRVKPQRGSDEISRYSSVVSSLQSVDLDTVSAVEVRGNQLILTLEDRPAAEETVDVEEQLTSEVRIWFLLVLASKKTKA